ncbi:MAG TPA: FAD-dependent oxidoreductase [Bacteroidia bacterium]
MPSFRSWNVEHDAGGGPTGVEISGTLIEMKNYVLPKDYHELDFSCMKVYLIEASPRLLNGMSEKASQKALYYLEKAGVIVRTNTRVKDYDGEMVTLEDGGTLHARTMVWAAGVTGDRLEGIPQESIVRGNRIKVDEYLCAAGMKDVYAIGDVAFMTEKDYPHGHPQVAQVAIQMGERLAENFKARLKNEKARPFHYKDLGSLATVGRNHAVADLPRVKFQGFFAWLTWMLVHLMSLVGFKNRVMVFINWAWSYFTYDQSLRLIIKVRKEKH